MRDLFVTVISLLALTTSLPTIVAAANDWAQWRGPNRDGICTETGLLPEWPEGGPALLWKITGLGRGYSTVTIVDGKLFTAGTEGDDEYIFAFNLATRQPLWKAKIGSMFKNNQGDGPRGATTVDSNMVYAIGGNGDLVCVDAATGKEIWRKNFGADFGGHMMSGWGYAESPLVDGEKLICTPGGKAAGLVALDKKTGNVIWKAALPDLGPRGKDGAAYSSCVISEACGIRQYVTLMGRGLVGVAAKDGKFLWSYNRCASDVANVTNPVVLGDYVFGSAAYKTGSGLVKLVRDGDGVKAEEVYFLDDKTFMNHHGGVVLVNGYLYGGHGQNAGTPVCIEFKTGNIAWRADKSPGGGSAAILYADGNLYCHYQKGEMVLIEASPKEYKVKSTFQLPTANGPHWPHPVIHDGRLYLRDQNVLLCYDIKKK